MSENLTRRSFCRVAGAGLVVIHLPGCGGGGGGFGFVPEDGGDAGERDSSVSPDLAKGPADMAKMPQPDMAKMPPDMAKAGPCVTSTEVNAGPAASIALDTATFFMCGGVTRIFVCRDQGGIYALSAICTHAGCNCNFNGGGLDFTCPCHGSAFDFNGAVTRGPAVSPLAHYSCALDGNGDVIVDHTKAVAPSARI